LPSRSAIARSIASSGVTSRSLDQAGGSILAAAAGVAGRAPAGSGSAPTSVPFPSCALAPPCRREAIVGRDHTSAQPPSPRNRRRAGGVHRPAHR
jgi:hypothetical protein